jgi:hypothetical protein
MPRPHRVTVALDDESMEFLSSLVRKMGGTQSAVVRASLKFFYRNFDYPENIEKMKMWSALLSKGEHVILDVDHWLLFLKYINSSPAREEFYREGKRIANSHAEQLASIIKTPEDYLKRLEACNLCSLVKIAENEFTVVLMSEESKRFMRELIEQTLNQLGFQVEIKEDLMKLRLKFK